MPKKTKKVKKLSEESSRSWCFTDHYETGNIITEDFWQVRPVTYAQWQMEMCPESGSLHYQGYVVWNRAIGKTRVRQLIPGAHVEILRGTHQQNLDYTSKEETRVEGPYVYGDDTGIGQGFRTDWVRIADDLRTIPRLKDIAYKYPSQFIMYHRGMERFRQLGMPRRNWKSYVIVLWGPPRVGKTREVFQESPDVYVKLPNSHWWDGYDGDSDILLDDHNHPWFTWDTFMGLLDRYPFPIEIKGSIIQLLAKRIYITCNRNPAEWYDRSRPDKYPLAALFGRIDEIRVFESSEDGCFKTVYRRTEEHDGIKEWLDANDYQTDNRHDTNLNSPIPAHEWDNGMYPSHLRFGRKGD